MERTQQTEEFSCVLVDEDGVPAAPCGPDMQDCPRFCVCVCPCHGIYHGLLGLDSVFY